MDKNKHKGKVRNIMFLLGSTLLGAIGQFLFKYAFLGSGFYAFLLLGLLAYGLSTLIYFYVLSRVNLTWAYGVGGLAYIFAVIFASTIETVPIIRWVGVGVITVGVFLIGMS